MRYSLHLPPFGLKFFPPGKFPVPLKLFEYVLLFSQQNSILSDLFVEVSLESISKIDGKESKINIPGVVCVDVDLLVTKILFHRNMDIEKVDINIGIDGGQGFLKVTGIYIFTFIIFTGGGACSFEHGEELFRFLPL